MAHLPASIRVWTRRRRCSAALLAGGVALALGACGSAGTQHAAPPAHAELPPSAPSVRGSENGMEMLWWGVNAGSRALAELLAPYLDDSTGLEPRTRTLWQTNGLRIVSVPIEKLDGIRQLLPQVGGVQRQWLGQVPLWTDIAHGTPWPDLQSVDMDNGRLTLGPGQLRILLRCWTIPVPGAETDAGALAAMRTELILQHQEPARIDPASLYTRPTTVSDPLDEGLVFRRLAASITLPPDRALLIIPESPQIDWRSLANVPPEQLSGDQAALAETRDPHAAPPDDHADATPGVGRVLRDPDANHEPEDQSPKLELAGPADPANDLSRTLGELLLSPNRAKLDAGVADRPSVRSVLVLVPRIPARFSIEGPAPDKKPAATAPTKAQ